MLQIAEGIYDYKVIDLEGCHRLGRDILGDFVTSCVVLQALLFKSEIGGVSTVGIS